MTLSAGTRLGSYEVVSRIGSGGMGDVYRARDTKLGRDVAIKILPDAFAGDADRLARFTREAQTLASLNHPNIATIYGVEGHAIVMELLDGATLREELSGTALTPRKAIDWGIQIAHGLAAAHEKGIVHRDLKPENVFVTHDGRLKLLDFGIARTATPGGDATMTSLGAAPATAAGVVLGTVGYMSPEQVRGRDIDERSDIFSLGAVLYEMLSGRRPFSGESPVETMNAILRADPPGLDEVTRIPPALDRIVRRCLEKRPADRFHSAHDVALALEAVSGVSTQPLTAVSVNASRRWPLAAAALAMVLAATGAAGWWLGSRRATPLPTFQRLTFERGTIGGARFIPNSTDVVYSAAWQGAAPELFTVRSKRPESLPVGQQDASLMAISPSQDLALMLAPHLSTGHWSGTLATAPIGGGGARQIATRVIATDFAPDGSLIYADWDGEHAHIRSASGAVIHEESSMIIALRAAPAGDHIAFVVVPTPTTPPLHIIDHAGASQGTIEVGYITGLAWTADGAEVLFSEASVTGDTTISAARPGGQRRLLWRGAGMLVLEDAASTGAMLARSVDSTSGVLVQHGASAAAMDMGWLDDSTAADVSPSADALLLNTRYASGNGGYYIRKLDGSPAVKLGDGGAVAWAPDGQHVLAQKDATTTVIMPVGPGTPRTLTHPDTKSYFGWYLPDGRILLNGQRQTTAWRFFFLDPDGQMRAVGPEGLDHWVGQHVPSDDGTLVAAYASGHNDVASPIIIPLAGGAAIPSAGFKPDEVVVRFTPDNQHLLVYDRNRLPVRIYSLDYRTGARALWREFMPADPTGIRGVGSIVMSPGGGVVAYNYRRELSTLYLVEGLR